MPRQQSRLRRLLLLFAVAVLAGLFVSSAEAAPRFAAPGGTGTAPCADPEHPCPLFVAAEASSGAAPGDEVVLAPGTYVDSDGDMGQLGNLLPAPGVKLHGEAGEPRPVLFFGGTALGSFHVSTGDTVSGITIVGQGVTPFGMATGVAEGIVVQAEGGGPNFGACAVTGGVLRDSACLTSDEGEAAILAFTTGGNHTAVLRNVTAVSTGAHSVGLEDFTQTLGSSDPISARFDAKGVIAEGTEADVEAVAFGGSTAEITLDHSDYDTVFTNPAGASVANVTPAGSGTNVTAPPLLATDDVHELAGSPTIDHGEADANTGALDFDGQRRTIGAAPDIGADESILPTSTAIGCSPSTTATDASTTCTVAVKNAVSPLDPPLGEVELRTIGGNLSAEGCSLVAISPSQSRCSVTFHSETPGAFLFVAEYAGDEGHGKSSAVNTIGVLPSKEELTNASPAPETLARRLHGPLGKPGSAQFIFISDQPDASFECSLDKHGFSPCHSPARVRVKPGKHVFRVRAVSAGHVQDPSPAVLRWRAASPRRPRKRR